MYINCQNSNGLLKNFKEIDIIKLAFKASKNYKQNYLLQNKNNYRHLNSISTCISRIVIPLITSSIITYINLQAHQYNAEIHQDLHYTGRTKQNAGATNYKHSGSKILKHFHLAMNLNFKVFVKKKFKS